MNLKIDANGAVTNSAAPAASGEFHRFLADIEDLIEATTSLTGADLAKAKAQLGARVEAARQSVSAMGEEVVKQARHGAAVTDGYVHAHPWQAIGIGAALGLIVGYALARRN